MKKINRIFLTLLLAVLGSCSYLDFDETSGVYTHDDMYRYFHKTSQMLTNVYRYIPQDLGAIGNAMRECACDDAEFGNPAGDVQLFNNGGWSSISTVDSQWGLYWGIRCANEFLESIKDVDFTPYKDDPSYENWMKQFAYFEYEARMLRAHFFFELARRYGDIAIPLKKLTIEEANTISKTSFDGVIDFIVAECNECSQKLPVDYFSVPGAEYGRITSGYAMALKSKALLYAASKLHNPSGDKERWKRSAKAALELINTGDFSLDPGDKTNTVESSEVVLTRMNTPSRNFEQENFPVRFTEGVRSWMSGTYPTQELVDAFQTINGYDVILTEQGWISDDPAFDPQKPYDNRDPRFYRTVLANGMAFKNSEIQTYVGGLDYSESREKGTPTGYYLRKYIMESTSFTPEAEVTNKHSWVIYRLAEAYLTYAESMIEAFDNPDYEDAEYTMSAREALNEVRKNASMPAVTVSGKDDFIEAVRREWRVEFAFEDHRFWDIRRWCIGSDTQKSISGVRITKDNSGFKYSRFMVENRVWNDRMNLYPIPQTELFTNPNLNPQNVGW